jgi:hypothetical protein
MKMLILVCTNEHVIWKFYTKLPEFVKKGDEKWNKLFFWNILQCLGQTLLSKFDLAPQTLHFKIKMIILHLRSSNNLYIEKFSTETRNIFQVLRYSYNKNSKQIIIRTPSSVSQFLPRVNCPLSSRAFIINRAIMALVQ